MNYVEEVDKAYDEFQDVYRDLERLVRSTDRLGEDDRQLLLIALGRLYEIVELLSELPIVDGSGRYIEEDFVVGRIRNATELLREVKSAVLEGNPDSLAEEELDVDVMGYAVAIREELLDILKRALEKAMR
jgi:CII-binding regulator of phage lambda lysogenization HflD